ncbi:MAG: hypothetical protein M3203_16030, partial [Actinomycetota bacterium]|nr:hypothetical protein [Actinomycetota bacterium]
MASTTKLAGREKAAKEFPAALADLLATWDEGRLRALLEHRPDLATPAPHSFSALAQRALEPASAEAAYHHLDRSAQQVDQVLTVLSAPTPVEHLAAVVAPGVLPADLEGPLARLEAMALAVREGGWVTLNPGLARLPYRAGLGPPLAAAMSAQSAYELSEMCRRLGVKAGANKAASVQAIVGWLTDAEQVRRVLKSA